MHYQPPRSSNMISTFTAKYTKIEAGYMGQLVEWPEVVTEGKDVEECREMLEDALQEMILASIDELSKMERIRLRF